MRQPTQAGWVGSRSPQVGSTPLQAVCQPPPPQLTVEALPTVVQLAKTTGILPSLILLAVACSRWARVGGWVLVGGGGARRRHPKGRRGAVQGHRSWRDRKVLTQLPRMKRGGGGGGLRKQTQLLKGTSPAAQLNPAAGG
jgi:hypothetical protein